MTNFFNTSPFIKTAFVALAFFAGSIPSASRADDFLASMSIGGLESQLSPDANAQDLQNLELLELGVCPEDPDLDELIRRAKKRIEDLEAQKVIIAAKIAIKEAVIKKEIEKLQKELARAIAMHDSLRAAIMNGLLLGKQAELAALQQPIKDADTGIARTKLLIDWFERCKTDPQAKP